MTITFREILFLIISTIMLFILVPSQRGKLFGFKKKYNFKKRFSLKLKLNIVNSRNPNIN